MKIKLNLVYFFPIQMYHPKFKNTINWFQIYHKKKTNNTNGLLVFVAIWLNRQLLSWKVSCNCSVELIFEIELDFERAN